jgi:hypothetical protein
MDGSRAMQEQLPRERVGVDRDMGAILTIQGLVRGGTFWWFFLAVEKKTLAHLLDINYSVMMSLACKKLLSS